MADVEGVKVAKNYQVDVEFAKMNSFHIKGAADLDWGMKTRLSNIFNPESGKNINACF